MLHIRPPPRQCICAESIQPFFLVVFAHLTALHIMHENGMWASTLTCMLTQNMTNVNLQVADLNRGAFGFVQLAKDVTTGEQVAIKFIERGDKVTTGFPFLICNSARGGYHVATHCIKGPGMPGNTTSFRTRSQWQLG